MSGRGLSGDQRSVEASVAEAGAGGAGGSSIVWPSVDAGPTPPTYCVAPCVWEVVQHCIPEMHTCARSLGHNNEVITCDVSTGWSEIDQQQIKGGTFSVSFAGAKCFSVLTGFALGFTLTQVEDSTGTVVAVKDEHRVYCGVALGDLSHIAQLTDAGAELTDGRFVPSYPQDPSRPECAAWDNHGLPVQPPCSLVDGGGCPTPPP